MDKKTEAQNSFSNGYLCSQSVLSAFCKDLGLDTETALKLSLAFGGGFARCGETCGAVTGALMVIGLKEGTSVQGETPEKQKTYKMTNDFIKTFKEHHGSITCKDLLHCDISQSEGYNRAQEEQLFETVCPKLVADSVDILEKLIKENDEKKRG